MSDFLVISFIILFLLEFVNLTTTIIDQIIFFNYFYEFLFFFFFIFSFFFLLKKEKFNVSLDILFKYFSFFLKNPSIFCNYLFIVFKQIYLFMVKFKYKFFISTNKILLKNFTKKFHLIWRPLFKKFSYFGFYRSNRSKWIK